jgi:carbohydrate-binding DOMON domain-containing protein
MASDNKTTKADPAPKSGPAAKDKSTSGEATAKTETKTETKTDTKTEAKTEAKTETKTESSETVAAAPSGYSRGEGQKPVSAAYKENWNAIFAKKKAKKKKR